MLIDPRAGPDDSAGKGADREDKPAHQPVEAIDHRDLTDPMIAHPNQCKGIDSAPSPALVLLAHPRIVSASAESGLEVHLWGLPVRRAPA